MELLTTLTLAHLLADFPLQTNAFAASKSKSMYGLCSHVAIHMGVMWVLLSLKWEAWPLVLGLGVAHFVVDWLKPRITTLNTVRAFILDQATHMGCIFITVALVESFFQVKLSSAISPGLLYPAVWLGFGMAMMVLGWLWTNTLHDEIIQQNYHLRWGRERLLEFEQRMGFVVLCVLGIGFFL